MAVAICSDFQSPLTKELWYYSASSIGRRKRFLSEESTESPLPHLPLPTAAKKIRSGDYVFSEDGGGSTQVNNYSIDHPTPPTSREEWVDLMIKEMMGARSVDDARSRAARLFDGLKESIASASTSASTSAASAEAESAGEARRSEEKIEAVAKENSILKRAVAIQHQRQKEYEDMNEEVKKLRALAGGYQDQVRSLELHNYALTMHLQQALHSKPAGAGIFPPDVF